jgi:RNA polymerase sigma-70 factor (ECF subfamily)
LDNRALVKAIYEHFDGLTDLQKDVVNLRFAGGLSLKETAGTLSKSVNSVKAIQHAAIKKLKDKIKETNIQILSKEPVSPLI